MNINTKKWYWAALGTIVLTVVSDRISDKTKDIPVLKYVVNFFQWLYNIGSKILLYNLQVWVILVLFCLIYAVVAIAKLTRRGNRSPILDYTSDVITEWLWKWTYSITNSGQYEMSYLTAYCKDCEVELRIDYSYRKARCPNCGKEFEEKGNYKKYSQSGKEIGEWEDYQDTLHIVKARASKLLKQEKIGL